MNKPIPGKPYSIKQLKDNGWDSYCSLDYRGDGDTFYWDGKKPIHGSWRWNYIPRANGFIKSGCIREDKREADKIYTEYLKKHKGEKGMQKEIFEKITDITQQISVIEKLLEDKTKDTITAPSNIMEPSLIFYCEHLKAELKELGYED